MFEERLVGAHNSLVYDTTNFVDPETYYFDFTLRRSDYISAAAPSHHCSETKKIAITCKRIYIRVPTLHGRAEGAEYSRRIGNKGEVREHGHGALCTYYLDWLRCESPSFVCLFYISTSSELSNNKPTIWSRGNRKS